MTNADVNMLHCVHLSLAIFGCFWHEQFKTVLAKDIPWHVSELVLKLFSVKLSDVA